jgi:hypothetical protein
MATDDRLRERFAKRFDMFDSNGDGIVRHRDLAGVAERLVRRFSVPSRSIGAERLRTVYETLWLSLLSGQGDVARGVLTRSAFLAGPLPDLGRRLAQADTLAVRECAGPVDGVVDIERVVEVVLVLGVHPGDAPLVREALKLDGKFMPLTEVAGLIGSYFAADGAAGLYGRTGEAPTG